MNHNTYANYSMVLFRAQYLKFLYSSRKKTVPAKDQPVLLSKVLYSFSYGAVLL
jgi:hypothetical protein